MGGFTSKRVLVGVIVGIVTVLLEPVAAKVLSKAA